MTYNYFKDNFYKDEDMDKNYLYLVESPSIIETRHDETRWYRLYSDGWCEQGGYVTNVSNGAIVTLCRNFKDTNYMVMLQPSSHTYTTSPGNYIAIPQNKTTNNFSLYLNNGSNTAFGMVEWQAKGFCNLN